MKVKDLLNQLGESYPEHADMNYRQFIAGVSQDKSWINKISYGQKHGPINPPPQHSPGEPGFTFILQIGAGKATSAVSYGPKLRQYLLNNFPDYDVDVGQIISKLNFKKYNNDSRTTSSHGRWREQMTVQLYSRS